MSSYKPYIENYLSLLRNGLSILDIKKITKVLNVIQSCYDNNKMIFTMGNGGSGTTASHMVCDFNNSVSATMDKRFKMMCLNDNMPTITATANDIGYGAVFEEQLKNWLQPGDVVIGISVSGQSENVIKAIQYANKNQAITIGFCGFDGGELKKIAQHCIHVDVHDMKIAEDIHSIISHILMKVLKERPAKKTTKI